MSATVDRADDAEQTLDENLDGDATRDEANASAPNSDAGPSESDEAATADGQAWYPDGPAGFDGNGGGADEGDGASGGDGSLRPWWQRPINLVALLTTTAICFALIGWSVGSERSQRHNAVDIGFLQDMRTHHEQATYMSLLYLSRPETDPQIQTVAVSILQGQSIEVGRMIQMLRFFGAPEAANLDEPPMLWMDGMSNEADSGATSGSMADTEGMEDMADMDDMDDMDHADSGTNSGDDVPLMPGMATESELDELQTLNGRAADELFVRLMIDHHLGGIDMADYAVAHAGSEMVRSMAESMSHGQQAEIVELTDLISTDG